MKEWKIYQQMYNRLVTEHSDARHLHQRVTSEEIVENALNYVKEQSNVGVYPAKSYIIAIIYATLLVQHYGEDFYEVLDDADLLCGQDDYFVPYSQDSENYDAIIARLAQMPGWIEGGWAPKTVEYFLLECTQKGVESVNA